MRLGYKRDTLAFEVSSRWRSEVIFIGRRQKEAAFAKISTAVFQPTLFPTQPYPTIGLLNPTAAKNSLQLSILVLNSLAAMPRATPLEAHATRRWNGSAQIQRLEPSRTNPACTEVGINQVDRQDSCDQNVCVSPKTTLLALTIPWEGMGFPNFSYLQRRVRGWEVVKGCNSHSDVCFWCYLPLSSSGHKFVSWSRSWYWSSTQENDIQEHRKGLCTAKAGASDAW